MKPLTPGPEVPPMATTPSLKAQTQSSSLAPGRHQSGRHQLSSAFPPPLPALLLNRNYKMQGIVGLVEPRSRLNSPNLLPWLPWGILTLPCNPAVHKPLIPALQQACIGPGWPLTPKRDLLTFSNMPDSSLLCPTTSLPLRRQSLDLLSQDPS